MRSGYIRQIYGSFQVIGDFLKSLTRNSVSSIITAEIMYLETHTCDVITSDSDRGGNEGMGSRKSGWRSVKVLCTMDGGIE